MSRASQPASLGTRWMNFGRANIPVKRVFRLSKFVDTYVHTSQATSQELNVHICIDKSLVPTRL